jgi:hypothetical protein
LSKIKYSFFSIITIASCKYKEQEVLAYCIELSGLEIIPCSFCKKYKKKYIVVQNSKKYTKYICRSRKYNTGGIPLGDWASLDCKEARLKQEKDLAAAEVLVAYQAAALSIACLQQLEKQQEFLKKKRADILCCSLNTIDKLDTAKAKEKEEAEVQERTKTSASSAGFVWLDPLSEEQLDQLLLDFPKSTAELQPLY